MKYQKKVKWSPGSSNSRTSTFSGAVTTNISGEIILTIAEVPSNKNEKVPLKHINLSYIGVNDVRDQSLYSQAPLIPLLNLRFKSTYSKTIPNGTYVFFVRYKIREGVFTKWYLASRPCFAGTSTKADTLQGGVKYINTHRDSANSFVFDVKAINSDYCNYYKGFQIGFIITHEEGTDARCWKYFDFDLSGGGSIKDTLIYFDYENVEEVNIDDLLEPTYEIYNVENVTVFKNQLYISNYIESKTNDSFNLGSANSYTVFLTNEISTENNAFTYTTALPGYNTTVYTFNKLSDDVYTTNTQIDPEVNVPWNSVVDGSISTSYSNIIKESEKTFKEVFSLVVGYDLDINPDIATVYDIRNNLKTIYDLPATYIFPASWNGDRKCAFKTWDVAGEDDQDYYNKWNVRDRKWTIVSTQANDAHPFYNSNDFSNLTHKPASAYACIGNSDTEHSAYKLGVTSSNCTAYPVSSNTVYAGSFTARDEGFNNETKVLITKHIKDYITQRVFNDIMCIELYCGTESYILDNWVNEDFINNFDKEYYIPNSGTYGVSSIGTTELSARGLTLSEISALNRYLDSICSSDNRNHLIGLTYTGELVFDIGKWYDRTKPSKYIKVNTIRVKLRKFKFDVEQVNLEDNEDHWYVRLKTDCNVTDYAVVCNISLSRPITYNNSDSKLSQQSSLAPLGKYELYLHTVDDHGIISDGEKINFTVSNSVKDYIETKGHGEHRYNSINLNLTLRNNSGTYINKNAFISIINTGNLIARCFDYNKIGFDHYVSCLEFDAMLYNETNNIKLQIWDSNGSNLKETINDVEYLPSGIVKPSIAFGNCGLLHWTSDNAENNYENDKIYVIIERVSSNTKNKQLIKATPYFKLIIAPESSKNINLYGYVPDTVSEGTDIVDCFYGNYVCNIRKPSFELSSTCYAVGNEVYAADRTAGIKLTDFEGLIQQSFGAIYTLNSNFNLNYLSLTQDLKDTIFKVGSATSGVKQVVKILDSATLSYIYELKSMYKDFMNVYFRPLQDNYKTVFDNTIRVSNVLSDETFNNDIYRFRPVDYYNVPTNRGKIIKLFSIGNIIYAHTESSLYKFDGSQMLVGNNTDIQLKESEPFDAGITQVFDSEYGYGGIAEKSASCVTFDSYFFYDRHSNHIFAYRDNQPVLIDNTIKLFLDYIAVTTNHCNVVPDVNNNRVFFNFTHTSGLNVTLSYNYKTKTFVSFHDLSLVGSFNTKTNVYHYKLNRKDVTIRGTAISIFCTDFGRLFNTTTYGATPLNFYGLATKKGSGFGKFRGSNYVIAVAMYPSSYITEVVNYIKYIGSDVKTSYSTIGVPETGTVIVDFGESSGSEIKPPYNPVEKSYIITDRCKSNIVQNDANDTDDTAVERQVSSILENIKGFKFDKGSWNFNYFRNELNSEDDFKYYDANGYGHEPNGYKTVGNVQARALKSDYNSLVYGRYFIVVFALKEDKQVKMEEIFISTEKY